MKKLSFSFAMILVICFIPALSAFGQPATGKPYKIGLITSLTGVYSVDSNQQKMASQFAVDEVNAAGGVLGRPLELLVRDDELKAEMAIRRADELSTKEKIVGAFGGIVGGVTLVMGPWAKRNKIPWFAAASMVESTGAKPFVDHPYFWFGGTSFFANGNILTDFAIKEMKVKKIYLLGADYMLGWNLKEIYSSAIPRLGGDIVGQDFHPLGTTEFGTFLAKVSAAKPDALFMTNFGADQIAALKAISAFGLKEKMKIFVTVSSLSVIKGAGAKVSEGVYFVKPYYWQSDKPEMKALLGPYMAKYKEPPTSYGLHAYMCVKSIVRAMNGAKTVDFAKAGPWILKNPELTGPAGKYRYVYNHAMMMDQFLVKGKAPGDIKGEYDLVDVIKVLGYTDDQRYMAIPPDLLKKMGWS